MSKLILILHSRIVQVVAVLGFVGCVAGLITDGPQALDATRNRLAWATKHVPFLEDDIVITSNPLILNLSGNRAQIHAGSEIDYVAILQNRSNQTVDHISIRGIPLMLSSDSFIGSYKVLSEGAVGEPISIDDEWLKTNGNVEVRSLLPNEMVEIRMTARVSQDLLPGEMAALEIVATSSTSELVSRSRYLTEIVGNSVLLAIKLCQSASADSETIRRGDVLTLSIHVCNNGNVPLYNVMVFPYLPNYDERKVTLVEGSSTYQISEEIPYSLEDDWIDRGFRLSQLGPGQFLLITFHVRVSQFAVNGEILRFVSNTKTDQTPNYLQCLYEIQVLD